MGTHPIFESDFDCLTESIVKQISDMTSELACTYAALILNDDDCEITGDKIATILKAAAVGELITNIGSGVGSGGAAAGGAAAPAAGGEAAKEEEKKPESSSEEEDDDMGFGLFD